jgi:hypothetical protein
VISYENGDEPGLSVFFDVYGFDADNLEPGSFINGDDVLVLFIGQGLAGDPGDGSVAPVQDKYGVVGVDGTGEVWEYADGYAYRLPGAAPSVDFNPDDWFFGGADSLQGDDEEQSLQLILDLTDPGVHECGGGSECPEDFDGDGEVNVDDLLSLLGVWGQSDVPQDLDGSGTVEVNDLLQLLGAWGPCEG